MKLPMDQYQLLALLLSLCLYCTSAEKCQFPKEWKGRWFQSGFGQVIIRPNKISRKGNCRQHQRDYFLLENKEENCFQCLLMMKRHKNIIQYKESFCVPEDSLKNICSQIRVEAILYTLVRDPSLSTKCPFEDAYYFNYNDNLAGFCDNAMSYMKPCVGHEKYELHFTHCQPQAFMNNLDVGYECIASWKDGSDMYLYAKMSGSSIQTKDDSYRCFKYHVYGAEIKMAMSFDATCRGLRSAEDGPFVMQFVKDQNGWPKASCEFPSWLSIESGWRDLEGKHVYSLTSRHQHLLLHFRKRGDARSTHLRAELRCVEAVDAGPAAGRDTYTFMTHATHNCVTKYQCVRIRQHTDGVAEISLGKLTDYNSAVMCTSPDEYEDTHLIMHDSLSPHRRCPLPGRYDISEPSRHCLEEFSVGCRAPYTMAVYASCDIGTPLEIECVSFWNDHDRTYIIGKAPGENKTLYNCFSFRHREEALEFSTEKVFSKGLPTLFPRALKFTISGKRLVCTDHIDRPLKEPQIIGINAPPPTTTTTTTTTTSPSTTTASTTTALDFPEIFFPFTLYPVVDEEPNSGSTIKHIIIDGYLEETDDTYETEDTDDEEETGPYVVDISPVTERNRRRGGKDRERERDGERRRKPIKQPDFVYNDVNKLRPEDGTSLVEFSDQRLDQSQGQSEGQGQRQAGNSAGNSTAALVYLANGLVLICVLLSLL